jgi:hypothetical protein
VRDIYSGATSVIELKGNRSEQIGWKWEMKEGYPLSSLLFNLCIEPLLEAVGCVDLAPWNQTRQLLARCFAVSGFILWNSMIPVDSVFAKLICDWFCVFVVRLWLPGREICYAFIVFV